jgi:phospholipid/cholesterol/gamma-HCH transport system permease protein
MTATVMGMFEELGGITLFAWRTVRTALTTRGCFRPILGQIASVSWRSLPTVVFSGVFVGAIIVIQFNSLLSQYEAQAYLGGLDTSAVIRQVGPLLISFLLAGKVGAFTAAELGTMRVTEQIDAIECLGTNPMAYLIVPRFFGIVISSLFLLAIGIVVSVAGSVAVAALLCQVNPLQFASNVPRFADTWAFGSGFLKSFVFGTIVAGVCCYKGYTASGGARGVGRAVTVAAVFTNLYVVIADYLTSILIDLLHGWLSSGGAS